MGRHTFGRITGIFYFHLKHLLHTTQELSVLLVTDTVIHSLEITKKPKLLKTAYICNKFLVRLHGEYNILAKLCGNTT